MSEHSDDALPRDASRFSRLSPDPRPILREQPLPIRYMTTYELIRGGDPLIVRRDDGANIMTKAPA